MFSAIIAFAIICSACNKDDVIELSVGMPEIILECDNNTYSVKSGNTLTITPSFKNCENAEISWVMDGNIVCSGTQWTHTWMLPEGSYFVTVTAKNAAGSSSADIRINVVRLTPPDIYIPVPVSGFSTITGQPLSLTPTIYHSDLDGFDISWFVNDSIVGKLPAYTFCESSPGTYNIRIEAENIDGTAQKTFCISVYDSMPLHIEFPTPSYCFDATTRYTFPNRPVLIRPIINTAAPVDYSWQINGTDANCSDPILRFMPAAPGEYTITLFASTADASASADVTVVCVDASEDSRMRIPSASSSLFSNKTFDYTPAPGQFIGESLLGDKSAAMISSPEEACTWAQNRLDNHKYVSLGAFGGYIVVGFDHSIPASNLTYDFLIQGNPSDTGNEPGIVWVMQDVNGNGLPDDEWYQLKGSEYDNPSTSHFFSVTYFRPAPFNHVEWLDSNDFWGKISYLPQYHNQESYYPAWINADAYTLYGSLIRSANSFDSNTGFWNNKPYPWGYADNSGNDALSGDFLGYNGFKISNAIDISGAPVKLAYIDFIKVQTAVMAESGALGEISTEVLSFCQYSEQ